MKTILLIMVFFLQIYLFAQMSVTTSSSNTSFTRHSGGSPGACDANRYKYVGGATHSGTCVTMTPANTTDNSAALWACNSFNLDSSFKLTASVTFGSNTALGDGIVFALKKSNLGDRMGKAGGYIGFHNNTASGTPIGMSLGVEFDTYNAASGVADENGDSGPLTDCNHAQIVRDGDLNVKVGGKTCLKADGTSVNDGLAHSICITWVPPSSLAAGGVFKAYIDGREVASAGDIRTYFDTKTVYWGFTAGDGAGTNLNNHIICDANMLIQDARKTALNPTCVVDLPIDLSFFKTESIDEKTNKIKWQTYTERENAFFTIEKSRDGSNFEFLAQVDGVGNSTQINDYEYIDYNPNADLTYYKLSQTDFDGKQTFLGIQYIENKNLEYTEIQKNPFEEYCKVKLKSKSNSNKELLIFDSMGKKIHAQNVSLNTGINDLEIDFTEYSDGVYFISFKDNEKSETFKVVKLKK
jgi:hypothetical protein